MRPRRGCSPSSVLSPPVRVSQQRRQADRHCRVTVPDADPGVRSLHAPYFDATDPQNRDNRQFTGSATYYVDTSKFGGHSIKGGFEHFTSTLKGGNSQTATGFVFDADYAVGASGSPSLDAEGRLMPVFVPGASLIENWRPLRGSSLDIRTLSVYLNDNWQLGNHYSFNVGWGREGG